MRVNIIKVIKMTKILVSILGIILICSCKTHSILYFRDPPEISQLKALAEPLETVEPEYPRNAELKGIEGWVYLEFDLNEDGKPINLKMIDTYPYDTFVKNAVVAIKKWTFKVDSNMAPQRKQFVMEFKLSD